LAESEKKDHVVFLDGYKTLKDGYTENPFAHYKNASATDIENEYFMQWIFPLKLHRIALRTAAGYKIVYKQAEDIWNNNLGIKIPDDKKAGEKINRQLVPYLRTRKWFKEMEKLSAYAIEQGESILLCYYKDQGDIYRYSEPIGRLDEIMRVEAFNIIDYHIESFDKYGDPAMYEITVKTPDILNSFLRVPVHPSRVLRFTGPDVYQRGEGYSDLAAVYDPINILSTILKAAGEAAFRWSTGHPVIFTKDLFTETDLAKLKDAIGDFTRRSWHMVPTEYVDRIDLLGQAGSMLNLKSLADVAIDQIVIGSGFPRPILLGEVAGVVSGSEVNERTYFALLDRRHTELESFIYEFFERDINIQKLLYGVEFFELDWGIREVLNKMDEAELEQKRFANALALMQICTIDECREVAGYEPIGGEEGEIIIPLFELELQMIAMEQAAQQAEMQSKENVESTSAKESVNTTKKKSETGHALDKKGKGKMKDAFDTLMSKKSISEIARSWKIHDKTFRKIYEEIKKEYIEDYFNKKEEEK
jgi:hypothetical protein